MLTADGDVIISWAEAIHMDASDFPRIADLDNIAGGAQLRLDDVVGGDAGVSLVQSWLAAFLAIVDFKCAKYCPDSTVYFFRSKLADRAAYCAIVFRDAARAPMFSRINARLQCSRLFSRAWTDAIVAQHSLCFHDLDYEYIEFDHSDNYDGSTTYRWCADPAGVVRFSLLVDGGDRPILWRHDDAGATAMPQHFANFHSRLIETVLLFINDS